MLNDIRLEIKSSHPIITSVVIKGDGEILEIHYNKHSELEKVKTAVVTKLNQKNWYNYFTKIVFINVEID